MQRWSAKVRWGRFLGGTLAALVLVPVPVLGFTILGNGSFFDAPSNSGPVTPMSGASATAGFSALDLGLEPASNSLVPLSQTSVVTTRSFQVASAGDSVPLTQAFETLLTGSSLNVTVGNPSDFNVRIDVSFRNSLFNSVDSFTFRLRSPFRFNSLGT